MNNPARSHFHRRMAEKAAAAENITGNAPSNDAHALLLAALGQDLRMLSETRSVEQKIAKKADMIDRYKDWVAGAIKAGKDGPAIPDDIVAYMMIWAIDLQQWDYAHDIALHLMAHDLPLPERFRNNVATLLADEVADSQLKHKNIVPLNVIQRTLELIFDEDVTDQANAKLHRVLADNFADQLTDHDDANAPKNARRHILNNALAAYERALKLDSNVGVKQNIKLIKSALKKLDEAEAAEQAAADKAATNTE